MALHTGPLGGLGQVSGPLETAGCAAAGGAGGGGLGSDPSQSSPMPVAAPPPPFMKYAPTPYAPAGGDLYANGGSGGGGGGGSGGLVYSEESACQPPSATPVPTIQMQHFPPQPPSQRLVQPPAIIDTGYYIQPCWGASASGTAGPPGTIIGQPQVAPSVQQPNYEESLMNNGAVVVVSSAAPSVSTCSTPGGYSVVGGGLTGAGSNAGDRRLVSSPMGPPPPPPPSAASMGGGLYGPRFTLTPVYHQNPGPNTCIPQQSAGGYMAMPTHHHDAACLSPGFAGAPSMNGQRLYMPSPQGSVGPAPRISPSGAPLRASSTLPFGYFSLAPPTPESTAASTMCPAAVPGPFSTPPGPSLLPPDPQVPNLRKTESTTTKKKRAKTAKSRTAGARCGNGRGAGMVVSASQPPKVVTVGPPTTTGLPGPPPSTTPAPPQQIMSSGMMLPPGASTSPQPPMWASRPTGSLMTNGTVLAMAPPPPPPHPSATAAVTNTLPCGLPHKALGPPVPTPNHVVHAPLTPHQRLSAGGPATVVTSIAPPPPQSCSSAACPSSIPHSLPPEPSSERLVCPITNGTVVRPMVLSLDEEQTRQSPNALQIRTFEFDVSKNHLETIVERPDLDIVVCSHLAHEPLQVCHWPAEAMHIRFNGTVFQLDRTTTADGQPAHRVCGVKALCRPSRNVIEVFLSPSRSPSPLSNYTLKDHRFAVFMAHMPAVNMVLDGLLRRVPDESLSLTKLLVASWRIRQASGGGGVQDQRPASITPPPTNQPVVAEISLICPIFRSRMQIPGRLVGCHHLEVFDMEAYLHREAVWSRLLCPICGNGSPAGLDNLYIDYFLLHIIQLVPKSVSTVQVRSDGFWRLSPPLVWQLSAGIEQWQPIVGPPTQAFAFALQVGPTLLMTPTQQSQLSLFQHQQQRPVAANGLEVTVQNSTRRPFGTLASPITAETQPPPSVHPSMESSSRCPQNSTLNPHLSASSSSWNSNGTPSFSNCSAQVTNSASPNPLSSSAMVGRGVALPTAPGASAPITSVPQPTGCRKRVLSTSSAQGDGVLHPVGRAEGQALPSSLPDLRMRSEAVSSKASLPKSMPTTPTLLKPSPPTSVPKLESNGLCKRNGGTSIISGADGSDGSGAAGGGKDGGCQLPTSGTPPSSQPSAKRPKVAHRQLTDEEIRWAFEGLSDLNHFDNPELIRFIRSLP